MSSFTADGTENRMRWDRSSAGFMEAWYLTAGHRDSGSGVWLRYTLTAPKREAPYCEVWAVWFDPEGKRSFAGKQRFAIDALGSSNGRDDGALVRIGSSWLSERHAEGQVQEDGRALSWSLDFEPADRCFQHLPPRVRRTVERKISTVCAPNLSVPFTGTVNLDDEIFSFEGEAGYQGHRWGKRHALSWTWAHCASWEGGERAVFEGIAARSNVGLVLAPTLTFVHLIFEGREIAFNEMKWALRARSRYEMPTWAFTARNDAYRITGAARTSIDRLMQVTYTDPDGSQRFCANTEIGDLGLELYERSGEGWRHIKSLTALRTAHVEFGRREPFVELPVSL